LQKEIWPKDVLIQ